MKKVFVFGGTGYLGTRICGELSKKGYEIVALRRKKSEILDKLNPEYVDGDVLIQPDREKIQERLLFGDIDLVVSCIGKVDYRGNRRTLTEVNVTTTEYIIKMVKCAQDKGLVGRFVFVGSAASRGFMKKKPDENHFLTEHDAFKNYDSKGSIYAESKHKAESIVNKAIMKGLDAVILEPGSLVGAGCSGTYTTNIGLIRKILKGMPVTTGGASYTSVVKVAECVISALESKDVGETYIVGGENLTMREFGRMVKKEARKMKHFTMGVFMLTIPIPKFFVYLLGYTPFFTHEEAYLSTHFSFVSSDKAKKMLGYKHSKTNLKTAIRETIECLEKEKKG